MRGQVQRRLAGGGGEAGGHGDQVAAQGGAPAIGVVAAGDGPGDAQQVVVITAQASQAQLAANSPTVIFSLVVACCVDLRRCFVASVVDACCQQGPMTG